MLSEARLNNEFDIMLDDIEAVIFDLDGSLADSTWIWTSIDIEYLDRFGIEPPKDLHMQIGGRTFSETAAFFKEKFNIPDDIEKIKQDWNDMAWDKYSHEVRLKKGAAGFMERCMEKNIKLAIATSNSIELVENFISSNKLGGHFDCIMTDRDVKRGKPAPDIYLAVADTLGVKAQNCLVFEDIVHGIMAGKAAGMRVCAVYDEASKEQDEEKKVAADYYIYDFRELPQDW